MTVRPVVRVASGAAGRLLRRSLLRPVVIIVLAGALLLAGYLTTRATGSEAPRCQRFAAESQARAHLVTGPATGSRVVVIGDSWAAGLGLRAPASSWPSRLPGRVHVFGFSTSGFSARASACGPVSFGVRAPEALRHGADLVVVEGGLNDFDQPSPAIRAGFERVLAAIGRSAPQASVAVVGPPLAPSRATRVPRVDRLLAQLCRDHGVRYLSTTGLALPYLQDGLHLTARGHRLFGEYVASRLPR